MTMSVPGIRPTSRGAGPRATTQGRLTKRQEGDIKEFKTACSRAMAVTCATAILMLAGSVTNGFADDGLWGAVAHYEHDRSGDWSEYSGYGVAINAPSMAEALTKAVERCREEEQQVPANMRDAPDWTGRRCDGTDWLSELNPGHLVNSRLVFSTSVPENPGVIYDVFPAVHALHARCVVVSLHWNADYPNTPKSFAFTPTNDPTATVEELQAGVEGSPQLKTQIEAINCNDR